MIQRLEVTSEGMRVKRLTVSGGAFLDDPRAKHQAATNAAGCTSRGWLTGVRWDGGFWVLRKAVGLASHSGCWTGAASPGGGGLTK